MSDTILVSKLKSIFSLWSDLVESLDDEQLAMHLGDLRSNTIGQQLWCLGGCRESNLASLKADAPFAWTCSYGGSTEDRAAIAAYLEEQAGGLVAFLEDLDELGANRANLLLDLLAHEFQHQGQVIRYLYGNGLPIPTSWQEFWHLEP